MPITTALHQRRLPALAAAATSPRVPVSPEVPAAASRDRGSRATPPAHQEVRGQSNPARVRACAKVREDPLLLGCLSSKHLENSLGYHHRLAFVNRRPPVQTGPAAPHLTARSERSSSSTCRFLRGTSATTSRSVESSRASPCWMARRSPPHREPTRTNDRGPAQSRPKADLADATVAHAFPGSDDRRVAGAARSSRGRGHASAGGLAFGSRAENRARPTSDYDLLVVMPDGPPELELDPVRAWRLGWEARVTADIVPCTRSEFEEEKDEIDSLPRAAMLRGRKIYER
jgi:hypothetical protein